MSETRGLGLAFKFFLLALLLAVVPIAAWWLGNLYAALGLSLAPASVAVWLGLRVGGAERALVEAVNPPPGEVSLASIGESCAKAMQEAKAKTEAFAASVSAAPLPIVAFDGAGKHLFASGPFEALFGKAAGLDALGAAAGVVRKAGESAASGVAREEIELRGRKLTALASGFPSGSVLVLLDQTEATNRMNEIVARLHGFEKAGQDVSDRSERVASAAEELAASADEQARGAGRQKEQTDSVAASLDEMTSTVIEVAKNAAETNRAAEEARVVAKDGVALVREAVDGIGAVSEAASKLSKVLGQLDEQASEIGRVINVINEIADQTNLLALNAAIEAARAGDAGRGFAVVADEVRKLAEKTMSATKEVAEAVHTIQHSSRDAMASMDETEKQVASSSELSNKAGQALEQIMMEIENMAPRIAQIATAAEEQSAAAEEITRAIDDIAGVAKETDEAAAQTAQAIRDLAALSQELLTLSLSLGRSASDSSKMKSSDNQMKGVLPKLMQEYVRETYGEEAYDLMQTETGNPVFLPTASYPDAVLIQMADVVAGATRKTRREILYNLGRFTIPKFHQMYRRHFKAKSLKEFLLKMNDVHAQLTKEQPGIKPPRFSYEDKGKTLLITYASSRGLFDYFEGILTSAADFMKERALIEVRPLDAATARAEVTFLDA